MTLNPYAIYINCDGAMDYDSKSSGGVGYVITFPDSIALDSISNSIGKYVGANIERLELEAIIQGMEEVLRLSKRHFSLIKKSNQIIFITDRFALQDQERTNPYRIKEWRRNNWHNHEGKPIKNSDLLDKLDKTRKKVIDTLHCRLNIEYQRRKKNKSADKLSKEGKTKALKREDLAVKGTKTGKRVYNGLTIDYKKLNEKEELLIHIYRKEPVREQWEIFAEICDGIYTGGKIQIYTDDILAAKLQRHHRYKVRLKSVFRFHVNIYKTIKEVKKESIILNNTNE